MGFVENDKISIIVPIYNAKDSLSKCIDSIIKQTYKKLEIILINDGSTDGSGDICDSYALKDNRIKVIHCKNGGVSVARNIGLNHCTGEYVGFIDSDDYIESTMYETMLKRLLSDESSIAVCGHNVVIGDISRSVCCSDTVLTSIEALKLLIEDDKIRNQLWSLLCKKEVYENIEFEIGKIYEDVRVIYKLFLKSKSVSILSNCFYNYIIREDSLSHNDNIQNNMDLFVALRGQKAGCVRVYPELEENCIVREIKYCGYMMNLCAKHNLPLKNEFVLQVFAYLKEDIASVYKKKVIYRLILSKYYGLYMMLLLKERLKKMLIHKR